MQFRRLLPDALACAVLFAVLQSRIMSVCSVRCSPVSTLRANGSERSTSACMWQIRCVHYGMSPDAPVLDEHEQ